MVTVPASRFLRFCIVGAVGYLIDAGVLLLARDALGLDLYSGRLLSYLAAATATWFLNRRFTFAVARRATIREWAAYLLANGVGALVNYAVYAAAILASDTMRAWPALAVAAGSLAGLAVNYGANRFYVFADRDPEARDRR